METPTREIKDPIESSIGKIGKWQWMIIVPLAIRDIVTSWQTLLPPFFAKEMPYWCQVQASEGIFESLQDWEAFSSPPLGNDTFDKCRIYDLPYSEMTETPHSKSGSTLTNLTKPCPEWIFEEGVNTIVSQFSLVCDRAWLITLSQVLYMFGILCGYFFGGLIADRYGRKPTLIGFMIVLTVTSFGAVFSNDIKIFLGLRWSIATSCSAVYAVTYVWALEIVAGKWKPYMGMGMMLPWAVGYTVLPLVAYYIRDWTHLQLLASAPLPIFLVWYFFLPECPRWLLSCVREKEANDILEKAAKVNGLPWPPINQPLTEDKESLADNADNTDEIMVKKSATILDSFKTPNLRRNTLISWFCWFTAAFIYYGLTLNADTLIPGNLYVNTAISGFIEIPAYLSCIYIIHRFGRRMPLVIMFVTSGVLLLSTAFLQDKTAIQVLVMGGKFGIISIFAIILHTSEVFPTVIRSSALGTCSTWGRIGSMLAPIIGRELAKVSQESVIVIFAVLSIGAGAGTLWLPETKGKRLPDTLEEGENQGGVETICKKRQRDP